MAESFATLMKQLEALKQRAEAARLGEREAVVAELREKVALFGLSRHDLFGKKTYRKKAKAPGAPRRMRVKYRHPETGVEWSGQGREPHWVRDAPNREALIVQ